VSSTLSAFGNGADSIDASESGDLYIMKPGTLHSLEDVIAWIYGHEGKFEAWWDEQRRLNVGNETKTTNCQSYMQAEIKEIKNDVKALRKIIFIAMGAAWALGSIISFAAAHLIEHGGS